jgi:nucleoside-diphosphate-sugar epimerase
MEPIRDVEMLEERLSRPTVGAIETLARLDGDVLLLGAGGKMGLSLARMARRALDAAGKRQRRVIAVSRFTKSAVAKEFQRHGIETIACDLLERSAVEALPEAANVLCLVGQKFGTSDAPDLTWVTNTMAPALIAQRYARSRVVVFSTGCVYALAPAAGPGSREADPLTPHGEYANAAVGRERVFEYYARQNGAQALFFRLYYAIDLRYGVLLDIAQKVLQSAPIDLTIGSVHVIWQGDANSRAIQCLAHVAAPPVALNVAGGERLSVHRLAERFGAELGVAPVFIETEGTRALVCDASRSYDWFGPPEVTLDEMIAATVQWMRQGGETLGKPTRFEAYDGNY